MSVSSAQNINRISSPADLMLIIVTSMIALCVAALLSGATWHSLLYLRPSALLV